MEIARRTFLTTLVVGAALAASRGARAMQIAPSSLADLVAGATHIVRARATDVRAMWSRDRIVTVVGADLVGNLKGVAPARIEILTLGGIVDGMGMKVPGSVEVRAGDDGFFFLARRSRAFRLYGGPAAFARLRDDDGHDVIDWRGDARDLPRIVERDVFERAVAAAIARDTP
jgi:hypothetical protein